MTRDISAKAASTGIRPAATAEQLRGAEVAYTPISLRLYDVVVHGVSNRYLWRCPTKQLADQYERLLSARHLDVGVGSGYFLDRARLPVADPQITLLDLNRYCLDAAAARIARYTPKTVQANLFEPLPDIGPFESVSLTYVFHCLPGSIREKAVVLDRIAPVLLDDAVAFGATILGRGVAPNAAARALMGVYNRKGVFSNLDDGFDDLEEALKTRFEDVSIRREGLVALFEAKRPRRR
mgnify:CR=1 FL=1